MLKWHNHSCTGNITNFPRQKYSEILLCKIHKLIRMNIDMITATNGITTLASVVDTSYYKPLSLY